MGLDRDEGVGPAPGYTWAEASRDRVPAEWAAALARDPLLATARVVVDLILSGGQRRVLVGPAFAAAAAARDGTPRRVHGELASEPVLSEEIEPGEGGLARRSVSISVSGRLIRPGAILAAGGHLSGRGEVSLLCDGMAWSQRMVWLRGPITGPLLFGRDEELVDLTISDPPIDTNSVPPWVLDAERWATIDESAVGDRVPIVVGHAILPCARVDSSPDRFLICEGARGYVLNRAWINGVLDTGPVGVIEEETDGLNLACTTIRFPTGASDENDEIHVEISESTANSIGLDLLEGVRRLMVAHDPDRVSEALFGEARAKSAQFGGSAAGDMPGIVINSRCALYQWIGSDLFSDHPYLSLVWDGTRIGPVAIDHRAEPVASVGPGVYPVIARTDGARYEWQDSNELRTRFTLRWDYDPVRDVWREISTRSEANNTLCAMAGALLESQADDDPIEALSIRDAASAEYVLDWLCEHRCRPSCGVVVNAYPEAWLRWRLGDTLTWTDAAVEISAPAIVVGRAWSRGSVQLRLRVYPSSGVGGGSRSF